MPLPRTHTLLAAAMAVAAAACANPAMDDYSKEPFPPDRPNETQPDARPPVPKRNPQAIAYELTMKLVDPPGPFAMVKAGFDYDVENERCLPRKDGASGTRVQARHSHDIALQRVDAVTYRGVFYDDMLIDEDYYGLGVCHWKLQGVGTGLRATGAAGETKFGDYLFRTDLERPQPIRKLYTAVHYPRSGMPDFPDFGEENPQKFRPEFRDKLWAIEYHVRRLPR